MSIEKLCPQLSYRLGTGIGVDDTVVNKIVFLALKMLLSTSKLLIIIKSKSRWGLKGPGPYAHKEGC